MRILIDTNVFLDFFLERENQFEDAETVFKNCFKQHHQIFITSMSLRDIGYVIQRTTHNHKKAKEFQISTYQICSKVIGISSDDAIESLYSEVNDYEDSLQMIAAEEAMCTAIITYNKKDFEKSKLPVYTPEEMCEIWSK